MMAAVVGLFVPMVLVATTAVEAAPPGTCGGTTLASFCVEDSTNLSPITDYKWLVSADDTGDPSLTQASAAACLPKRAATNNPDVFSLAGTQPIGTRAFSNCAWPSVRSVPGGSNVVASGTNADKGRLADLPAGKYLISVIAGEHKIDGVHFEVGVGGTLLTVNEEGLYSAIDPGGAVFAVRMNPFPKQTATLRVHVYNDNASTNGQWDGQTETLITCADATPQQRLDNCGGANVDDVNLVGDPSTDMSGFSVHINDVLAEVTTDVFGNPLCTEYMHAPNLANGAQGPVMLDGDGSPIVMNFGGALAGTQSTCLSDHYGDIYIPNLGPNRYAVSVSAPDARSHDSAQWVQTTTLEGGHDWDSWNLEGGSGYDTELIVGGERVTPVAHGFVKLTHNDAERNEISETQYYDASQGFTGPLVGTAGSLTGSIHVGRAYIGSGAGAPLAGTNLSNAKEDGIIEDGLISISCIATCNAPTDSAVWTGRAKTDGTFTVTGLQPGDYTVSIWDESQSYILAVLQYSINSGATTIAGEVLLSGWFTDLQGSIFYDCNGDGIRQDGEATDLSNPSCIEKGVPDYFLSIRTRGNSLQDQGATTSVTGEDGSFDLGQAYPLGQFLVVEAYNPRYKNTGFTYTTDNDPNPHTVESSQVDIDFLPIIGLSANLDWGVQAYDQGENGGIAGTVTYDVTRNEFDPAFSAPEDYQPSIPNIPMQLWKTQKDPNGNVVHYGGSGSGAAVQVGVGGCTRPDNLRGTDALAEGQSCKPFDYYMTETWTRPTGCVALDVTGAPLAGELALPGALDGNPAIGAVNWHHDDPTQPDCVESPMNGFQIGGDGSVNGNYALSNLIQPAALGGVSGYDALSALYGDKDAANWDTLVPGDYVVEAVNPADELATTLTAPDPDQGGFTGAAASKKKYRFTDDTSINVFSGDTYEPQEGVSGGGTGAPGDPLRPYNRNVVREDVNTIGAGTVAKCGGTMTTVAPDGTSSFENDFTAGGGNPYAGELRPVCDAKVVKVVNGRSVAPTFFMYTDVPIPAKFYGLLNDDLNVQTNRRSILLGEVAPVSNGPIGIYDENGNWKYTAHSDFNGNYEVLLPSMDTYNCPLPAGPCANVYRLVGNDPGTLDHRNTDYNPQFRTISTNFQAWTGVIHPVDQAPTHIGITIEGPAAQFGALSLCQVNQPDTPVDKITPEIYAIDRPYFGKTGDSSSTVFTLNGVGFGAAKGAGQLQMDGTGIATQSWNDRQITFQVPSSLVAGAHQLSVKSDNGLSTVNGLTFHVLGTGYLSRSDVYEVRSDVPENRNQRTFNPNHDAWDSLTNTPAGFSGRDKSGASVSGGRAIQRAIDAAHGNGNNGGNNAKLIVIYPNLAPNYAPHNPNAAYFENVVVHGKVTLQGVGPGGAYSSTSVVRGTNIDASLFWAATQVVPAGGNQQTADGSYSDDWRTFANGLNRVGNGPAELPEGEAILAIAERTDQYANYEVSVGNGGQRQTFENLNLAQNSNQANRQWGVDGILISGGDQQGNPGGINTAPGAAGADLALGGLPGPAQGGAIMLDQYVRRFNITNNLIQSNGGTYGAVRVGTPDLADQDNHNERLKVASNRFVANGGTNLAGALGLFAGSDLYEVAGNDFCGNFSAEYGGAISHYGASPGGLISKNRIYYNQSYDEGGGIMIAGNLPANNSALSDGAGGAYGTGYTGSSYPRTQTLTAPMGVTIDSNTMVSNQSNDDGGGIRFLMAGNFPMLVKNNIIANNLATHEGAGIALDDAPDVTIVNNTVVKNITTGTAATNGAVTNTSGFDVNTITPAGANVTVTTLTPGPVAGTVRPANPAGLSTGGNSTPLQNTLPAGSPNWSKPVLINNLFADNRAGWAELPSAINFNTNSIKGIGTENGSTASQRWDIGVSSTTNLCNTTVGSTCGVGSQPFAFDSVTTTVNTSSLSNIQPDAGIYLNSSNMAGDGTAALAFQHAADFLVDSLGWRVNTNVSFPVIVAQMVPVTLLADYHLTTSSSLTYAVNSGTSPSVDARVPNRDIDGDVRPQGFGADRGADEIAGPSADLSITKTDGKTTTIPGATNTYTIVVANAGPSTATDATVTDALPVSLLTGATWSCSATAGASCGSVSGSGSINTTVTLPNGASATFTLAATVAAGATGSVTNTATVDLAIDPNTANNSATDTDQAPPPKPTLNVLDNFNRASASNLGSNWVQATLFGLAAIRVNNNQAFGNSAGTAFWNTAFGTTQAAAFRIGGPPSGTSVINGDALILKSSGLSWIRVRVTGTQIVVEYTNNGGISIPFLGIVGYTTLATFASSAGVGNTITALVDSTGQVSVWNGNTFVGWVNAASFTGGGGIGISLPTNGRIDDFAGGTVA